MRNKKNFMVAAVCVIVMGLTGCAKVTEKVADNSVKEEVFVTEESEKVDNNNTQIQNEIDTQTLSFKKNENITVGQTDAELEEELKKYRQEREEMIQEANGLVEGGSPDEDKYSFDMSGLFYTGQFDTREMTEAYAVARIYVTEELEVKPETKMITYMCVDPRILAIYDDEDKGVAKGYENNNIFVCEYRDGEGTWQYLILVRDDKGKLWKVIHNGSSYKE